MELKDFLRHVRNELDIAGGEDRENRKMHLNFASTDLSLAEINGGALGETRTHYLLLKERLENLRRTTFY